MTLQGPQHARGPERLTPKHIYRYDIMLEKGTPEAVFFVWVCVCVGSGFARASNAECFPYVEYSKVWKLESGCQLLCRLRFHKNLRDSCDPIAMIDNKTY